MDWFVEFWYKWAEKQAVSQYYVATREREVPEVVGVDADLDLGEFIVEFATGVKLRVLPLGNANVYLE